MKKKEEKELISIFEKQVEIDKEMVDIQGKTVETLGLVANIVFKHSKWWRKVFTVLYFLVVLFLVFVFGEIALALIGWARSLDVQWQTTLFTIAVTAFFIVPLTIFLTAKFIHKDSSDTVPSKNTQNNGVDSEK